MNLTGFCFGVLALIALEKVAKRALDLAERKVASDELGTQAYVHEVGYEPPTPDGDDDDGDEGDGDTKAPPEGLTASLEVIATIDGDDRQPPTVH